MRIALDLMSIAIYLVLIVLIVRRWKQWSWERTSANGG